MHKGSNGDFLHCISRHLRRRHFFCRDIKVVLGKNIAINLLVTKGTQGTPSQRGLPQTAMDQNRAGALGRAFASQQCVGLDSQTPRHM